MEPVREMGETGGSEGEEGVLGAVEWGEAGRLVSMIEEAGAESSAA